MLKKKEKIVTANSLILADTLKSEHFYLADTLKRRIPLINGTVYIYRSSQSLIKTL